MKAAPGGTTVSGSTTGGSDNLKSDFLMEPKFLMLATPLSSLKVREQGVSFLYPFYHDLLGLTFFEVGQKGEGGCLAPSLW